MRERRAPAQSGRDWAVASYSVTGQVQRGGGRAAGMRGIAIDILTATYLNSLAKTHLVSEDAADSVVEKPHHPVETLQLILAQGAILQTRRLDTSIVIIQHEMSRLRVLWDKRAPDTGSSFYLRDQLSIPAQ